MQGHVARKRGRYYAVIYEALDPITGKERRIWHPAGNDRADAEAIAARLAQERDGRNDEIRSLTYGAYLTGQWLPAKKLTLEVSTYWGYVHKIQRHILPALGRKRLRRLRPEDTRRPVPAHRPSRNRPWPTRQTCRCACTSYGHDAGTGTRDAGSAQRRNTQYVCTSSAVHARFWRAADPRIRERALVVGDLGVGVGLPGGGHYPCARHSFGSWLNSTRSGRRAWSFSSEAVPAA